MNERRTGMIAAARAAWETELGSLLSTAQVRELLGGVSRQRVDELRARRLIGLPESSGGGAIRCSSSKVGGRSSLKRSGRTGRGGSLDHVATLVRDPQPAEFEAMLDRRRRLGQDLFDEVWEGVVHMNAAPSGTHGDLERQLHVLLAPLAKAAGLRMRGRFNLGDEGDYRVPDAGLQQDASDRVYYATAALVIEIVSPGDESWEKLPFYAAHGVGELLIIDPQQQTVS